MWQRLKHFFVPYEGNTYKPHFLERFSMGIMFLMVLLMFAIANIQAIVWIGSEWMVSTILPAVITDLTNGERENSVGTLVRSDLLDAAARRKAEDMAEKSYFAHYSPEGVSPWYWFDQVGYDFAYAGENLAVHFTDSEDVVEAWMHSPAHKANIMNKNYTEIGIGSALGEYEGVSTVFVVQLFGTPQKPSREVPATSGTVPKSDASDISPLLSTERQPDVLSEQAVATESPTESVAVPDKSETSPEVQRISPPVQSDLATTSRDQSGPSQGSIKNSGSSETSLMELLKRAAIQPKVWLQLVYVMLALLLVTALGTSLIVEWKRRNPLQIFYTTALLGTMGALFYAHTVLTSGVSIL